MISTIAVIATGGALGAVMRYLVSSGTVQFWGSEFPYGTLIVNVIGSFLMGLCIAKFAQMQSISEEIKLFLTTGFLGAFTTFSTFSLDFITLWERGDSLHAVGYMLSSVILSIAALALALFLMRGGAA